jgi:hypothetical protein
VFAGYVNPVLGAQQIFQQYLERVGEAVDIVLFLQRVEAKDFVLFAFDLKHGAGSEAVGHGTSQSLC